MKAASRTSSSKPRVQACVEGLESRQLMSGTIALVPATGTLHVLGTAGDDRAAVVRDNRGTATTVDDLLHVRLAHAGHGHSATFLASRVKLIVFKGYAGNDTFQNATNISSIQDGGAGNDTLVGGSAADRIFGRDGNDKLFGLGARDRLEGGNGNDYLDAGADGIVGDVVLGQAGVDTFKFRPGDVTDRLFFEPLV